MARRWADGEDDRLFDYGLNTGGPGVMTVGWIVVSFFSMPPLPCVAWTRLILYSPPHRFQHGRDSLRYSDIWWPLLLGIHVITATACAILLLGHWMVSTTYTAHRIPYFAWDFQQAYALTPTFHRFNLLGQIAVTTGIDFGLANLISLTAEVSNGYEPSAGKTLGILAVILTSHVVLNLFSMKTLRYMIYTSVVLQSAGVFCIAITALAKAHKHQSAHTVFSMFYDGTGTGPTHEGWSIRASNAYVAAVGILMSQYTILGYDASAHLCEETRKAVKDAPLGLVSSVIGSCVVGFFLLVSLLFSIEDMDRVRNAKQPVLQILTDACGMGGGLVLMVLILLCIWHCGLFSLVRYTSSAPTNTIHNHPPNHIYSSYDHY